MSPDDTGWPPAGTWTAVRANRWARAASVALGDRLERRGAIYTGCSVHDDGTREMRWCFPPGRMGAPWGRWREMSLRARHGSVEDWEIVYTEKRASLLRMFDRVRPRGSFAPVYHYSSLSRRARLEQLPRAVDGLLAAGLAFQRRHLDDCGCRRTPAAPDLHDAL